MQPTRSCCLPEYPAYAGKVPFSSEILSPGGQVATAMVACARLGLRAKYIGTIGDDLRGEIQRQSLDGTGVDTSGVIVRAGCPNQTAYILIDQRTGERTVLWHRADCLRLRPEDIRPEDILNARIVHLDGCDTEAAAFAAKVAHSAGIPVTIDVDTVYPGFEAVLKIRTTWWRVRFGRDDGLPRRMGWWRWRASSASTD